MEQTEDALRQAEAASRPARWVSISLGAVAACVTSAHFLSALPDPHIVAVAWTLFGTATLVAAAIVVRAGGPPRPVSFLPAYLTIAFIGLALLLYRSSIGIGLLSDDFALLDWATRGELLPASWPFVRPLPLMIWGGVARVVPAHLVPPALHVLSIGFHGVNAFLVVRLARILGSASPVAILSGVLFLVYPSSVEAVTWPSAFPDVLLTTLILTSITFSPLVPRPWVLVSLLAMAALATKETAVVMGPLLFLLALVTSAALRRTFLLAGLTASLLTSAYLLWRLVSDRLPSRSGFAVADVIAVVVGPFGALSLPLHDAVVHVAPWGVVIWALALSVILAASPFRWRHEPVVPTMVLLAVPWILLTVAPTVGLFGVGADLQGSRYLYLPTCVWALALTTSWLAPAPRQSERYLRLSTYAIVVLLAAVITQRHQRPWTEAATLRDITLSSIAALPAECRRVLVIAPPDDVEGAYVARNGLPQALARAYGRDIEFVHRPDETSPQCRLDLADLTR